MIRCADYETTSFFHNPIHDERRKILKWICSVFLGPAGTLVKSYGVILSSRMVNWQWVVHGPKNVFMMY